MSEGKHLCLVQQCPEKVSRLGDMCDKHAVWALCQYGRNPRIYSPPPANAGRASVWYLFVGGLLVGLLLAWVYVMIWDQLTQ